MKRPLNEIGKTVGKAGLVEGKDQEFAFGDIKCEMPARHSS